MYLSSKPIFSMSEKVNARKVKILHRKVIKVVSLESFYPVMCDKCCNVSIKGQKCSKPAEEKKPGF